MRLFRPAILRPRRLGIVLTGLLVPAMLAACAGGGASGGGGLGGLFGAGDPNAGVTTVQTQYPPDFFLKSGYCPQVQILPGAESLTVYDRGHDGEADFIRSQGSITRTARECHALDAGTLSVKLGVAGRVLAGPKGGAGTVTMPLRVAVSRQHDGTVLFSKAFTFTTTLSAPDFAADYSEVFDQITFKVNPDDRDLVIFVGFDEGKPKGKAGT